jgi:hypothetical protein
MKSFYRINPWIFGILFLTIFIYLALNFFEINYVFLGKTNMTEGRIIGIKTVSGIRGQGYNQRIEYAYNVGEKTFIDHKTIGKDIGIQSIGNRILIKYSENKPEKNNVLKFIRTNDNQKQKRFISSERNGYEEILLENSIFRLTKYAEKGILLEQKVGEYELENDTLILKPYFFENKTNEIQTIIKLIVDNDSLNKTVLTEIITRRKFK